MISAELKPLYRLLEKNVKFQFDDNCREAFKLSKDLMMQNQCLVHYDPNKIL